MTQMPKTERLNEDEEEQIVERTSPPGEVVYHAVYREGEHELQRTTSELALSGLAAGLSMGLSMMSEGLLQVYLPAAPWRPLLTKLGYSVGFMVVILGRQQLFTKNTLTVILPLLHQKKLSLLGNVGRLWAAVLLANLLGAFVFAWFMARSNTFDENVRSAFFELGEAAVQKNFTTLLLGGIVAGWLIALMVWLLPFAEAARIWVVIILSYVIGVGSLPHVIAGSVETLYLVADGALPFWTCVAGYIVPVLIGNVIGGVALVAIGAHTEFIEATD
jgi:formate-nitrite transporter family protein